MDEEQERAAFEMLGNLACVDTYDVNLCNHPEAWEAVEAFMRAALSQPAIEPVAWRCRSWGADEWAYFDGDDKPETVAPAQLAPLYASQPASDEAAAIMELAHVFMVRPQGESNYDQVEARLKAFVNRVDRPAPEAHPPWCSGGCCNFAEDVMDLVDVYAESVRDGDPQEHQISARANIDHLLRSPAPEARLLQDETQTSDSKKLSQWFAGKPNALQEAREAAQSHLKPSLPAAPNEGLSHLNRNGAEAWKDVPRTGDWVADAGAVDGEAG